jgi:hypothetical protein
MVQISPHRARLNSALSRQSAGKNPADLMAAQSTLIPAW